MKVIFVSDCSKCPFFVSRLELHCGHKATEGKVIEPLELVSFRDEREEYCPTPEWCVLEEVKDDSPMDDLVNTYLDAVMKATPPQPDRGGVEQEE